MTTKETSTTAKVISQPDAPTPPKNIEGELLTRISTLENIVKKIAHFTGTNRILLENGVEPWEPGADDMRKIKG